MRIVFMGTPEIALETLKACIDQHDVIGVFTQPDRPSGRGKKLTPPPVKVLAASHGIPVFQPEKIKSGHWADEIRDLKPDVLVVIAYGQILSKEILEIPKYGAINVHASLLPAYRGAAPINWVLVNGETESGVTTMQMDVGLDTGDMLLKAKIDLPSDMTAGQLHDQLGSMGAKLLIETLEGLENGSLEPEVQDDDRSSYAPMIHKEMANINWQDSAENIHNRVRGFNPWPTCFTLLNDKRMKVFQTQVIEDIEVDHHGQPGEIVQVNKDAFVVACGKGYLKVLEIQYGNGKRMSVQAFLLGNTLELGSILKEA